MKHRRKPLMLILDNLPAHKGPLVRAYVDSLKGKLQLHYLPGDAPELNPDELVWSHVKNTGTAIKLLRRGDQLQPRIDTDLRARFNAMPNSCARSSGLRMSPILLTSE
jgi:transposase